MNRCVKIFRQNRLWKDKKGKNWPMARYHAEGNVLQEKHLKHFYAEPTSTEQEQFFKQNGHLLFNMLELKKGADEVQHFRLYTERVLRNSGPR